MDTLRSRKQTSWPQLIDIILWEKALYNTKSVYRRELCVAEWYCNRGQELWHPVKLSMEKTGLFSSEVYPDTFHTLSAKTSGVIVGWITTLQQSLPNTHNFSRSEVYTSFWLNVLGYNHRTHVGLWRKWFHNSHLSHLAKSEISCVISMGHWHFLACHPHVHHRIEPNFLPVVSMWMMGYISYTLMRYMYMYRKFHFLPNVHGDSLKQKQGHHCWVAVQAMTTFLWPWLSLLRPFLRGSWVMSLSGLPEAVVSWPSNMNVSTSALISSSVRPQPSSSWVCREKLDVARHTRMELALNNFPTLTWLHMYMYTTCMVILNRVNKSNNHEWFVSWNWRKRCLNMTRRDVFSLQNIGT